MQGKRVIIRTLDIGADKTVPYLLLPKEDNPAMGIRGLRLCLQQKQMFLTQLKALLRASVHGKLDIMLPMVASAWEIDEVKKLLEEAKQILEDENKPFGSPGLGIMIETPAAVVISEELARKVDFFSIGTNDLMQYMLAADRMNPAMGEYVDPHHPALYKLIEMTVFNGHRAGIPVGICGEAAADESMTEFFISIGVDELSMPAGDILSIRKKIRSLDFSVSKGKGE
ncbi:MAG: phosphoenolpyruvate--protein phosphotransferase, partial [Eubacterium sp.]|nr:phosphoenolpyruvate--protein phosphotransferase [Eubacterium sp.]